jgi:hypothetical protein
MAAMHKYTGSVAVVDAAAECLAFAAEAARWVQITPTCWPWWQQVTRWHLGDRLVALCCTLY